MIAGKMPPALPTTTTVTVTTTSTATADLALELVHVSVTLGARLVIDDASVAFAAGRAHAVVGRSGAGKSVLMKAAAGLLPRVAGSVRLHRAPLRFVHQDPALLDDLDVEENVRFPLAQAPALDATARRRAVHDVLEQLSLTPLRRRHPSQLTPSQARRVALARALVLQPAVLIVDEPTTGLDPVAGAEVDDALASLVSPQRTLIVITHHPRTLARLSPRIVVVDDGRVRSAS